MSFRTHFISWKVIVVLVTAMTLPCGVSAMRQLPDTVDIYGAREDSLDAAVFTDRLTGNYLAKGKDLRTEVISSAGLRKMACCNLAESFENSASVTVGYSDAVTGARQIRLLGLSGVYTQMLDENRPVMRGLAAPFGLSYVPSPWLESIQVSKGLSSVSNGVEALTGQINTEYRKPTDEKPLFVNASVMNDTKTDFNVASSLQLNDSWSTVIFGHVSGNFDTYDHNHDGFMDDPEMLQFNLANRWLYYADSGAQLRFGLRALKDSRKGGQEGYNHESYSLSEGSAWGSDITNRQLNAYVKLGIPISPDNAKNIALVADYTLTDMDSWFGATKYLATQHSCFANIMWQNEFSESHRLTLTLGGMVDGLRENFSREVAEQTIDPGLQKETLGSGGIAAEYTFHAGETLSAIAAGRADWFSGGEGLKFSPRLTLKYSPASWLTLRANGGRGIRRSMPLADNIGVLSTGKAFRGDYDSHILEDAWTFGGNVTFSLPFGVSPDNSYISLDYFGTSFGEQLVVDYEHSAGEIWFYSLGGGESYTHSWQADFSTEPIRGLTLALTFRYTSAKTEYEERGLCEKPLTSRYKGVLNLQYATNLNKWVFDFTASVNGKARVYDFMRDMTDDDGELLYEDGFTPAYPMLYLQVTKRFKGMDVYLGAENLTGYRQKHLLVGTASTESMQHASVDTTASDFDASCVWGPIMGAKYYLGFRLTLWKKG